MESSKNIKSLYYDTHIVLGNFDQFIQRIRYTNVNSVYNDDDGVTPLIRAAEAGDQTEQILYSYL